MSLRHLIKPWVGMGVWSYPNNGEERYFFNLGPKYLLKPPNDKGVNLRKVDRRIIELDWKRQRLVAIEGIVTVIEIHTNIIKSKVE